MSQSEQENVDRGAAADAGGGRIADAAESLGAGSAGDEVQIEPLEERPEVAAAIADDTTAPGLGGDH